MMLPGHRSGVSGRCVCDAPRWVDNPVTRLGVKHTDDIFGRWGAVMSFNTISTAALPMS